MHQRRVGWHAALAVVALPGTAAILLAQSPSQQPDAAALPSIDSHADRVLREMSEFLKSAQSLSFRVDSTLDSVRPNGRKIQLEMSEHVAVRRPGHLRVDRTGDEGSGQVYSDGQTFVMYDADENTFAKTAVPNELSAAIDHVWEEFAIEVPVADLVYADPYAVLTEHVQSGQFVGKHTVNGVLCDHLAFTQETIDWQIWVEDGHRRLPRKMVVTYKQRQESPQYTAVISNWQLDPKLSDHIFRFEPPAGAHKIEFLHVYDLVTTEGDEQ